MKVVVIGTGRVGLPFALSLIERNVDVVGVDINTSIRNIINQERRMPFREPGFDELVASGRLRVHEHLEEAAPNADYFVLTVGTPLLHHIETDLSAVTQALSAVCRVLRPGQTVILRSTTAPGTTDYARRLIERETRFKVGREVFVACCPERIVEGAARQELTSLPQLIGAADEASSKAADALFRKLGPQILHCSDREAELVKLFNNTSRYVYFAVINALAMIALEHKVEPHRVLELANRDYPRPILGRPGFTAGTCLRKDFGMLSESSSSGDILIEAWRINESMPRFLVRKAQERFGSLTGRSVAVLGYSFKRDADDVRDSLASKLLRYIHRETPGSLAVHDPFVDAQHIEPIHGVRFVADLGAILDGAEVVFVATNHSEYEQRKHEILASLEKQGRPRLLVDLWNCLGTGRIFTQLGISE
jgi:UDP-N-acetyl-D-mannosaminuronic acid dehydrogenase